MLKSFMWEADNISEELLLRIEDIQKQNYKWISTENIKISFITMGLTSLSLLPTESESQNLSHSWQFRNML